MRFVILSASVSLVLVAACADQPQVAGPSEQPLAPLLATGADQAPDRYIVVFKSHVTDVDRATDEAVRGNGAQVFFRYRTALKGFAGSIPAPALEAVRQNPNVQYVEANGIAYAIGDQTSLPSWGIDRIDERDLPMDGHYLYDNDAPNVHAYIIDTGIWPSHTEFGSPTRVSSGYDFIDNDANSNDCHGHGTHVAGTVGGTTTGVAKLVRLVGVRVLSCSGSGTWDQVIAGVDWVAAKAIKPAVANMSLGGGFSQSLNDAVTGAVNAGVTFAIAAGNSNANACNYSPASTPSAITVGASTSTDARSSFSNYGSCLDIFAPGSAITSSTMDGGYQSWNGTSMATPHVAGAAALLLSANPSWTPTQVASAMIGNATLNKITSPGTNSPNRLLYTLAGATPPPASVVMHVSDLDPSATSNRNNWSATVTVTIQDAYGALVSGALVSGNWSNGASGAGSCTTGTNGTCQINKGGIKKAVTSVTFSVTSVTRSGSSYNAAANGDPDGNSNGTTITIARP